MQLAAPMAHGMGGTFFSPIGHKLELKKIFEEKYQIHWGGEEVVELKTNVIKSNAPTTRQSAHEMNLVLLFSP